MSVAQLPNRGGLIGKSLLRSGLGGRIDLALREHQKRFSAAC
jgi:hypothetical protein